MTLAGRWAEESANCLWVETSLQEGEDGPKASLPQMQALIPGSPLSILVSWCPKDLIGAANDVPDSHQLFCT